MLWHNVTKTLSAMKQRMQIGSCFMEMKNCQAMHQRFNARDNRLCEKSFPLLDWSVTGDKNANPNHIKKLEKRLRICGVTDAC